MRQTQAGTGRYPQLLSTFPSHKQQQQGVVIVGLHAVAAFPEQLQSLSLLPFVCEVAPSVNGIENRV